MFQGSVKELPAITTENFPVAVPFQLNYVYLYSKLWQIRVLPVTELVNIPSDPLYIVGYTARKLC